MAKGVDPFAPRQKMKFNMSMLFGNTNYSITSTHVQTVFEGDYFPNIPIGATNPTDIYAPETHYENLVGLQFNNGGIGNSNSKLFHKSFLFTPPSIGTAYEDCTSQNFKLPQTPNTTTGCTISANLPYVAGETIKFSLDDSNFIIGTVISYNSANGDISFEIVSSTSIPGTSGGPGTWCISLINSFTTFETTAFAYYSSLGEQWGNNLGLAVPNVGSMGSPDGMTVTSYLSTPADPPAQGSGVRTFLSVSRGSQNILGHRCLHESHTLRRF